LAGVLSACRLTGCDLRELRVLFIGAGSAATGIADLLQTALVEAGLSRREARTRLWFADIAGLVVKSRKDLAPQNEPYAHDLPPMDVNAAIETLRPQVLIGATGVSGVFTEAMIRLMAEINRRPVIFALSNPTSRAECTAEQAYRWSDGRAVFASGSPFAAVNYRGQTLRPGQGNNAYIFPGIGLGAIACGARLVSDEMFLEAARVLAGNVEDSDLKAGTLYPPLSQIRRVSLDIAVAVADKAYEQHLATVSRPEDWSRTIGEMMYDPVY
ncbi:MAG: NAD-dependent malic enzyme, partial [Gammaproteobacteria bacterium]